MRDGKKLVYLYTSQEEWLPDMFETDVMNKLKRIIEHLYQQYFIKYHVLVIFERAYTLYNPASFNYKPFRFEYDMHAVNVRNISY